MVLTSRKSSWCEILTNEKLTRLGRNHSADGADVERGDVHLIREVFPAYGFRFSGFGSRDPGFGFRISYSIFRVSGSGFGVRVSGFGLGGSGLGSRFER